MKLVISTKLAKNLGQVKALVPDGVVVEARPFSWVVLVSQGVLKL